MIQSVKQPLIRPPRLRADAVRRRHRTTTPIILTCTTACIAISLVTIITASVLVLKTPYLPQGSVLLQDSEVVLVARFQPSGVDRMVFNHTKHVFKADFYDDLCEDIKIDSRTLRYSKSLSTSAGGRYSVSKLYLAREAILRYFFSYAPKMTRSSCTAKVFVFAEHSAYRRFLFEGETPSPEVGAQYCLPNSDSNYTLNLTAVSYHYVALESYHSTTLNISVHGSVSRYNVSSLSPATRCAFPSENCTVFLDYPRERREVCVLGALPDTGKFLTDVTTRLCPDGRTGSCWPPGWWSTWEWDWWWLYSAWDCAG